jgi:TonB family protein
MRPLLTFCILVWFTALMWGESGPRRLFGTTYPRLAHLARVQGPVRLEATVSGAGTVSAVRVIEGNSLLAPAAVESLKRWSFPPCGESLCKFEVKFVFILEAGECRLSECPNDIEFAWPDTLTVRSKYAKPIIN